MNHIKAWRAFLAWTGLACVSVLAHAAPDSFDTSFGQQGVALLGYVGNPTPRSGAFATNLAYRDDGTLLVAVFSWDSFVSGVMHVNADGTIDTAFGVDGIASLGGDCAPPQPAPDSHCSTIRRVLSTAAGPFYSVLAATVDTTYSLARFTTAGMLDRTYGVNGINALPFCNAGGCRTDSVRGAAIDAQGRMVLSGCTSVISTSTGTGPCMASTARFTADGGIDRTYGSYGGARVVTPIAGNFGLIHVAAGGKFITTAAISAQGMDVVRLLANGLPDPSFGQSGVAHAGVSGTSGASDAIELADGRVLAVGASVRGASPEWRVACVDAQGIVCAGWGAGGVVRIAMPVGVDSVLYAVRLLQQADGKVLVVGDQSMTTASRIALARLNGDGTLDTFFAGNGVATAWTNLASSAGDALLRADGKIVVAGAEVDRFVYFTHGSYIGREEAAVFVLEGGNTSTPRTVTEEPVAEYYDAAFDHYFITALALEISNLNTGGDWAPTGRQFKVWKGTAAGLVPVCRFFSGASFAPKSSHFYTPYAAECAGLKAGSVWTFEGNVFNLALPLPGGSACAPGQKPLYRLYNNGQGGAPAHRYTDDLAVLEQMVAQGWIFEGDALTKVFACIPGD